MLRKLKKLLFSKEKNTPRKRTVLTVLSILLLGFVGYFLILKDLPSPANLGGGNTPQSSQIFDRNDKLLYTIYANENRTTIPLSEIPKSAQYATISSEDKDFYNHGAIDIRGIARSVFVITTKGQIQGGSTLTQQLVKNSLLTPEQTIKRKIKEVILAFATEILYSKDQILEMYLNQIPYGGTAYGIEAASQTFFGKKAKDLTIAESALLAGLPEAPSVYSPFGSHPELAKERQETILSQMLEQGYINKKQYGEAVKEKLKYQNFSNTIKAPHFVFYVRDLLIKKYGEKFVEEGGLKVKTTLDLPIQEMAEASLSAEISKLAGLRVSNGAALITNPGTGEVLAMIGSKDYFDSTIDGNVNVTLANRQPGSSIKPINYATGIIKGFSTTTVFVDEKVCFPAPPGPTYCPNNYDGKFHGVVQMREALGNSFNIPAVKMLKMNGVDAMIATASAMGINTFKDPKRYGLSLTLGGGEVTMTDMATAFGVFANGGYRIDLNPILEVKDKKNKVIEKNSPPSSPIFGKKVISEGVAFIISHILSDNNARLQAFGASSELRIGSQPISVKTGTTNDLKDNWTIGYTKDFLVAVWVGNNDSTPMSGLVSGVTGAAPIWHDIMSKLVEIKPASLPNQPSSVIGKIVCATSGLLPGESGCPTKFEYFLRGKEPKKVDPGKQKVWIDKNTNDLAKPGQTDNLELRDEYVIEDGVGDKYCVSCPHPTPSTTPTPTP
ncbi:MAG: penicillin-binding protein [Candidatus Levybacteria bacterium]|nr:penicillin-binding protein [Candidatus Levybacteria bacterium]